MFSRLRYPILFQPLCYFLPYGPISYGRQPLFWYIPYFILLVQLYHVSISFLSGYIPSSALNTVLLVVLEHPSAFF